MHAIHNIGYFRTMTHIYVIMHIHKNKTKQTSSIVIVESIAQPLMDQ